MSHLAAWIALSAQAFNENRNYTNSVTVAVNQETGWNVSEAWAIMNFFALTRRHD